MKNLKINTYILCGGKSSRMKREKGLVEFNGKSFIEHILAAVAPLSKNMCLITANRDYEKFGYKLIKDIYPEKGPLGGIYTALSHSSEEKNLILSCDIPFINQKILEKLLIKTVQEYVEVSHLADAENSFPLIGVYKKRLVEALECNLQHNQLRVQQFIQNRYFQKICVTAGEAELLKNINTQEELASLR